MIADTISSRGIEQEGREEREVEVFPVSGLPDLPVQKLILFRHFEIEPSLAFGRLAFVISS
jgi:hypothetical protein